MAASQMECLTPYGGSLVGWGFSRSPCCFAEASALVSRGSGGGGGLPLVLSRCCGD